MENDGGPEFSRIVMLEELGRDVAHRQIKANEAECAALARRLGLPAIDGLSAELELRKSKDGKQVSVDGRMTANVTQECVVSLDPFDVELAEPIEERFAEIDENEPELPVEDDLGEDEEAYDEPIVENRIDLGEMLAQCLSLALDPYPRQPGV